VVWSVSRNVINNEFSLALATSVTCEQSRKADKHMETQMDDSVGIV